MCRIAASCLSFTLDNQVRTKFHYGKLLCVTFSTTLLLSVPLHRNYTIVNEVISGTSTADDSLAAANRQLRSPAQIATSSDGLLYITNDKDGEIIVADESTLELKGVKCLASTTTSANRSTPQWLNIPTSIGSSDPSTSHSVVILPTARLQDSCNLHTLTANVNGSFLKVSSANLGHWNACSVCFGPEGQLLIGNSRYNKVYTYNMTTGFVGDMEVDCKPSCLAYDHQRGCLHVCDSSANIVKVFSEVGGRPIFEYGRKTLVVPKQISIDANSCSYVVCSFNLSCFLAVFDPDGEHMFNVYGFESPSGVAVSHNQSTVWVSDIKKNCLVKFEGLCTLRPPFPVSLFCQKTILLHMNELSLSQLPQK